MVGQRVCTITANPVEKQDSIMVKLYSDAREVYMHLKPYAGIPNEVLLAYSPQTQEILSAWPRPAPCCWWHSPSQWSCCYCSVWPCGVPPWCNAVRDLGHSVCCCWGIWPTQEDLLQIPNTCTSKIQQHTEAEACPFHTKEPEVSRVVYAV